MSNKAQPAVMTERVIWRPRFTIKRFESADAHARFSADLRAQLARFETDPVWRTRVERAAKLTREAVAKIAVAWLPNDFKNEVALKSAYNITEFADNLLLNDGIDDIMWTLICGGAADALSNANAYLGVGDSDTAAAASQTDLQAETNKLRVGMEDGYPTYASSQKATFQSSFGGDDANYAWKEFITANASSGATALNRKVSAQGTKTSGQVWVLTEEITLS